MTDDEAAGPAPDEPPPPAPARAAVRRQGERRTPMALAVLAAAGLYLLLPDDFHVTRYVPGTKYMSYLYPVLLLLLLGLLIIGDPGRIDREKRWLRITTGVLISIMTAGSAAAAIRLVISILDGKTFGGAHRLLEIGAIIWAATIISYSLWYWHLDCGGPTQRAKQTYRSLPAFHFPEHSLQGEAYVGWYPQYVDYLALSFNTATAFSPTDVSAVRHWSKMWLITESAISLALMGLVIAQAVNELGS